MAPKSSPPYAADGDGGNTGGIMMPAASALAGAYPRQNSRGVAAGAHAADGVVLCSATEPTELTEHSNSQLSTVNHQLAPREPVLNSNPMDNKYQIPKPRKPETKQEALQLQIEDLVRRRDASLDPAEKQKLNAEITRLFAQYQRLKI